jgi:hypothetical protein
MARKPQKSTPKKSVPKKVSTEKRAVVSLNDKYRVVIGTHNYNLETQQISISKKTKKETLIWSNQGYFSTMVGALKKAAAQIILDDIAEKDTVFAIEEFNTLYKASIRQLEAAVLKANIPNIN